MSLRIRRGTDAQRQTLTFDQGEVVYTTDTKKLYMGDGITAGGTNILATSAGTGVTFNATTQAFDFNTAALGITTSDVAEGSRKYFTTQRAQDAAAALFTSTGSPPSSGTITGTIATGTIVLNSADSALVNGSRMVIAGAGGNGISAGTYYVVSAVSTSVVLASSLANATNGIQITGISTGSVTGTTYTAGGTDSGITFVYDSVNHVINVVSNGTSSLVLDTNPRLGANLGLNSFNITGTGNINTTGTLGVSGGLSRDLSLNSYNLTGTGNVTTTGLLSVTLANYLSGAAITANGISSGATTSTAISLKSTRAANTALQNNDIVGTVSYDAWTGTVSTKAVIMTATMASNITSNNFSSKFTIYTLNADTFYRSFVFDQNGGFTTTLLALTGLSSAQIAGSGITPVAGAMTYNTDFKSFQVYNGTQFSTMLNLGVASAPANSTATGVKGQTFVDDTYFYIATGVNSWRRVALSTF
jgi:Major tropism determinant N-terminal domain